jgi:hypothetical protein
MSKKSLVHVSVPKIRKLDDESLSDLMAHADKAIQDIQALRPSTFTLDDLTRYSPWLSFALFL